VHPERILGILTVVFSLLTTASACTSDSNDVESNDVESNDAGATESVPNEQIAPSRRPRVKYKSGARYASDLATALEIERDAVCRELGQYDCVDQVHRIVLGGVEPYTLGVRDPLPSIAVTAPIAQDRVALAACTERITRDLAGSEPLFLKKIDLGEPTRKELEATAKRFYDRILRRAATSDEVSALTQFHSTVTDETSDSVTATRDWAVLSCFMVATTLESIFY
jgi:hypothetical protein